MSIVELFLCQLLFKQICQPLHWPSLETTRSKKNFWNRLSKVKLSAVLVLVNLEVEVMSQVSKPRPKESEMIWSSMVQKMWITNAFQADWICLLANDTACAGKPIHMNKSLICVPMDTKGITLAKKIDKMGMRASDTAVLYLEDVRVPAVNVIGDPGMGFSYQMIQFQEERLACQH